MTALYFLLAFLWALTAPFVAIAAVACSIIDLGDGQRSGETGRIIGGLIGVALTMGPVLRLLWMVWAR